jgi:MFS family permease
MQAAGGPSTALVGAIVFAVAVAAFGRIPLLPDMGRTLDLGAGEIGLLTTAFGLGRLLTDLPAGRLADAVAPTVGLAAAGALLALSCGMLAVAESLAAALAASALIGCASALTNTTGMYVFATTGGAKRRGAHMGLYITALMSGQMLGPVLGGVIGSVAGWRPAIAVSAAIGVAVVVICGAAIARSRSRPNAMAALGERDGDELGAQPHSRAPRPELVALALAPFATFFGMAGLTQTLIPLIGDGELDLSVSVIGIAIGVGAVARFASAWTAGVMSDRLSRKVVLVPCLALMTIGAAILVPTPTVFTWCASIALVALGSSGVSVAAAALADRVPAAELGRELGLFRLVGDFGLLAGPLVTAFIYQASGPRFAAVAATGVFVAATLAAVLWVRDADPSRGEGEDTGEILLT